MLYCKIQPYFTKRPVIPFTQRVLPRCKKELMRMLAPISSPLQVSFVAKDASYLNNSDLCVSVCKAVPFSLEGIKRGGIPVTFLGYEYLFINDLQLQVLTNPYAYLLESL